MSYKSCVLINAYYSSQLDMNDNNNNKFRHISIVVDFSGHIMINKWVIHENIFSLIMVQPIENKAFDRGKYQS